MIWGSAPKRRLHRPWLRITTRRLPGVPSEVSRHLLKAGLLIAVVYEVRQRKGEAGIVLLRIRLPDLYQRRRLRIGQRAQQNRIDHTKERRVGADSQRQSQNRHSREAWRFQHSPSAITQILKHFVLQSSWL